MRHLTEEQMTILYDNGQIHMMHGKDLLRLEMDNFCRIRLYHFHPQKMKWTIANYNIKGEVSERCEFISDVEAYRFVTLMEIA